MFTFVWFYTKSFIKSIFLPPYFSQTLAVLLAIDTKNSVSLFGLSINLDTQGIHHILAGIISSVNIHVHGVSSTSQLEVDEICLWLLQSHQQVLSLITEAVIPRNNLKPLGISLLLNSGWAASLYLCLPGCDSQLQRLALMPSILRVLRLDFLL